MINALWLSRQVMKLEHRRTVLVDIICATIAWFAVLGLALLVLSAEWS